MCEVRTQHAARATLDRHRQSLTTITSERALRHRPTPSCWPRPLEQAAHPDRSNSPRPAGPHAAPGEVGHDLRGVGNRAGEPVQADHHQRVPGPAGRHRLRQTRPGAGRAEQPHVGVDPTLPDPRRGQRLPLRYLIFRCAGPTERNRSEAGPSEECVPVETPSPTMAPDGLSAAPRVKRLSADAANRSAVPLTAHVDGSRERTVDRVSASRRGRVGSARRSRAS